MTSARDAAAFKLIYDTRAARLVRAHLRAEKWIAGLSALVTLLTAAMVVKGPENFSKAEGSLRGVVRLGDPQRALRYYEQALRIRLDVGDRVGEAVTRYNVAMIYRDEGDLDAAIAELEQVVELDRIVLHPDLESDMAMLKEVVDERGNRG